MTTTLTDNVAENILNYVNNKANELTDKVKGVVATGNENNNILPGDDPIFKDWGAPTLPGITVKKEEKNNTLLYVGIGLGIVGLIYYFTKK